jgi:hypothetical protein
MDLKRLLSKHGPSIHVLSAAEAEKLLELPPAKTPVVVRRIRGHKARSTAALFDEMAAALQFPSYFGENWNALDECLNDLEWLPGDAYVLCFERAPELLSLESLAEFESLLQILTRASLEWGKRGKPFRTIFESSEPEDKALMERLKAAKADVAHRS